MKVNNETMGRYLNTAIAHNGFLIYKKNLCSLLKFLMIFHYIFPVSLDYSFILHEMPSNKDFILSLHVII